MLELDRQIKASVFRQIYLLTGEEDYLRRQYRDRLIKALVPPGSMGEDMNYSYFTGGGITAKAFIDLAETMPFFAERRLIVLEDTDLFAKAEDVLLAYLESPAPTACLLFVEKNPDHRSKMYKALQKHGMVVEFNSLEEKDQARFLQGKLKKSGLAITGAALELLIRYAGPDLNNLSNELEKVSCYCMEKGGIREEDVLEICYKNPEDTVFAMVDAVSQRKQREVFQYYGELLRRREAPLKILALIARQYNLVLQYADGAAKGEADPARAMGLAPFLARKYASLSRTMASGEAFLAFQKCLETDEAIKSGKITDKLGVETLLMELSQG